MIHHQLREIALHSLRIICVIFILLIVQIKVEVSGAGGVC